MGMKSYIIVKTQFEGAHFWEGAPLVVQFLRNNHRHVFKVEAKIPVSHNDRALEFFMVKEFLDKKIKEFYPKFFVGEESCEMMAEKILRAIMSNYKIRMGVSVLVSEDGENAGVVEI